MPKGQKPGMEQKPRDNIPLKNIQVFKKKRTNKGRLGLGQGLGQKVNLVQEQQ